jgi:hypothetical protein
VNIRTILLVTTVSASTMALPAAVATSVTGNATRSALVDHQTTTGVIGSVDDNSFMLTVGEKTTRFRTNEKSSYMLDGKASTRDKVLTTGASATVMHDETNLASRIEVTTTKP